MTLLASISEGISPKDLLDIPAVFAAYDVLNISTRLVSDLIGYNSGQVTRWRNSRRDIPGHILLVLCWILQQVINEHVTVWDNPDSEGMKKVKIYSRDLLLFRILFADLCLQLEMKEFVRENSTESIRKAVKEANILMIYELERVENTLQSSQIEQPIVFDAFGNINLGADNLRNPKLRETWKNFMSMCKNANEKTTDPNVFNAMAVGIYEKLNSRPVKQRPYVPEGEDEQE